MKAIYELQGKQSIRKIAETLGISRNTVRRYLRDPDGALARKPRPRCPSKLDPYKEYIMHRLGEGVDNCVVLLREIRQQGYTGGYTILKDFVRPFRRRVAASQSTMRFETAPGEQAQVDWGSFAYRTADGKERRVWAFVMVLSWSRAMYVEFVSRPTTETFIRCHLNAFAKFGGLPKTCLYDNTKLVVQRRDATGEPVWNRQFLDFALRLGFDVRLCRPYRAQTKGRVESGIKYVKHNFWVGARFTDLDDLNRQVLAWIDTVADVRVHGTTFERPVDRLQAERTHLTPLPGPERLRPFQRATVTVGRDGYVRWERAWYGLPWPWKPGQEVQLEADGDLVSLWSGDALLAVHPKAAKAGQRLTHPRQWSGLPSLSDGRRMEPTAVQLPTIEVERRSLAFYDLVAGVASR